MILALFFIVSVYYLGYLLGSFFIPHSKIPRLTIYFLFGSIFSCSFIFITNFLAHNLIASIAVYFFFFLITAIFTFKKNHRKVLSYLINRQNIVGVFVVFLVFLFFQRTFNYDTVGNFFNIQSNLFQDFGAHISFIRYFSNGGNYLPAVPLFSGENLFYHFMFDFYSSILERIGLRIDYAFNLISALSFVHFYVIIIGLSNLVFKSKIVGYIAGAFLFLGTDLSFLQLVDKYGFSITSWYHHNSYIVGELLGVETVKSFLSINTYINQRHLIFALLFFSSIVFLTYENRLNKIQGKVKICMVLLLGFFPFWHITALISSYFFLLMTALINRKIRKDIIWIVVGSAIITLPQLLVIKLSSVNEILFNPGFLLAPKLSFLDFFLFWVWNLGLLIPLVLIGLYISNRSQIKLFLSFLPLFVIPNLFQFSRDIFDNHKFFNFWMVIISIFSVYAILKITSKVIYGRIILVLLVIVTVLSGFFHLFVVKNDVYATVPDYKYSKLFGWVNKNIDESETLFTNGDIYDPAALSGRKIFLGRAHYIYLYGGDPTERIIMRDTILHGENLEEIRQILTNEGINYILLYKSGLLTNEHSTNYDFFELNFEKIYEDNDGLIYKI